MRGLAKVCGNFFEQRQGLFGLFDVQTGDGEACVDDEIFANGHIANERYGDATDHAADLGLDPLVTQK
jgi:hypothetical protein